MYIYVYVCTKVINIGFKTAVKGGRFVGALGNECFRSGKSRK